MASKRASFGENSPPTCPFNLIYKCDLRGWGGREIAGGWGVGGWRETERYRKTEKEAEMTTKIPSN
jgi:hypothetical protein